MTRFKIQTKKASYNGHEFHIKDVAFLYIVTQYKLIYLIFACQLNNTTFVTYS